MIWIPFQLKVLIQTLTTLKELYFSTMVQFQISQTLKQAYLLWVLKYQQT